MKRRGRIGLMLGVLFLLAGFVYTAFTGLPYKRKAIADETLAYLTTQRFYAASDIKKVEGSYSFKSEHYQATVVYADEPNVHYTYEKVDGSFKLVETSDLSGKHMDETFYP